MSKHAVSHKSGINEINLSRNSAAVVPRSDQIPIDCHVTIERKLMRLNFFPKKSMELFGGSTKRSKCRLSRRPELASLVRPLAFFFSVNDSHMFQFTSRFDRQLHLLFIWLTNRKPKVKLVT
jgi:hypothetical protein